MRTPDYLVVATKVFNERFPTAACAFVAGSVISGNATPSSDIDLVVLFDDESSETYRESITREGWPLEIFVHNLKSQDYFLGGDTKRGECVMANMISKGIILGPNTELAQARKKIADDIIAKGPEPLSQDIINSARYVINDLFDDLRHPKDSDYIPAILARLLIISGDFYLRAQNKWSGSGKALIRILKQDDPDFAENFLNAFRRAQGHDIQPLEKILREILVPYGGFLFDDYKSVSHSWKTEENNS